MRVLALLLASSLSAQSVTVENYGPTPFDGWHRCNVSPRPAATIGWKGQGVPQPITGGGLQQQTDAVYVVGKQSGLDTWHLDVRVRLAPGQRRVLDLATFTPIQQPLPQLRRDAIAFFGGAPAVNGETMGLPVGLQLSTAELIGFLTGNEATNETVCQRIETLTRDGSALLFHFQNRTGRMFVVDLWFRWYPDQPAMAQGEVMVTCSNPAVPDMGAVATSGVKVAFGDASVFVLGGGQDGVVVKPGTVFADGQARVVPITLLWPRHGFDVQTAIAHVYGAVQGHGVAKLLADGNPVLPAGFSARAWASPLWMPAVQALHSWAPAVCGPASNSPQAGEQEDGAFSRGEAMLSDGAAATVVAYLSALKLAARPIHHREADGSMLNPALHTTKPLIFWNGRPHESLWNLVDRLGKPTPFTGDVLAATNGWLGPDPEHAMFATLAGAARLTGSPACQTLLRQLGVLYPTQWTTTPGWSNSDTFAARAVGWEALLAVHLWRELEDRPLALVTRAHWLVRWSMVLLPKHGSMPRDITDPRLDDPRLGDGWRWIPWQQALEAYGLDHAGLQFGIPSARALALRLAKRVLDDAWRQVAGRWVSCASGLLVEPGGTGAAFDESFNHYGMPLAACVVLRHEPTNTKALAILAQVRASATELKRTRWIAPQ